MESTQESNVHSVRTQYSQPHGPSKVTTADRMSSCRKSLKKCDHSPPGCFRVYDTRCERTSVSAVSSARTVQYVRQLFPRHFISRAPAWFIFVSHLQSMNEILDRDFRISCMLQELRILEGYS